MKIHRAELPSVRIQYQPSIKSPFASNEDGSNTVGVVRIRAPEHIKESTTEITDKISFFMINPP